MPILDALDRQFLELGRVCPLRYLYFLPSKSDANFRSPLAHEISGEAPPLFLEPAAQPPAMAGGMMGGAVPPGIDPALLLEPRSNGAQALQHYGAQCHDLPGPGLHTAGEWPAVVDRMNRSMQMMKGMMRIEAPKPAELKALVEYLQQHGQRPLDPAAYPDLDQPAGQAFRATCSQCHALPAPRQHTVRERPCLIALSWGRSSPSCSGTPAHRTDAKRKHL